MKETIDVMKYTNAVVNAIPMGILLNSKAEKFDSMVIGWGSLGVCWSRPVFTVYVRKGRFTREQLDANPEFTISIPINGTNQKISKVCGSMSGRDVDKVDKAGLELEDPRTISVPGIRQYPLTLECKVLYRQEQELNLYPDDVKIFYPQDVDSSFCGANKDAHVMYMGEILDSYLIQ